MSGQFLAVRKAPYDGLKRSKQVIVRGTFSGVLLGHPAPYEAPGGEVWLVWTHRNINRNGLSWLGALAANFNTITDDYDIPITVGFEVDRVTMRIELADAVRPFRVSPRNPDIEMGDPPLADNPYQEVLDDQSAPQNLILAGTSLPDGWTAVGDP